MQNPLTYIPAKFRWIAYLVLGVAALVLAAVQAAHGDWLQAIALLLGSLGFGTAGSNVTPSASGPQD